MCKDFLLRILSTLNYLCIGFLAFVFFGCERKESNILSSEQSVKKIKSIIESFHDPVEGSGVVEYTPESSEDSFVRQLFFNPQGNLVRTDRFNSYGNLEWSEVLTYNKKGNVIEKTVFQLKKIVSKQKYTYNAMNKLIESSTFDENGKIVKKQMLEVDSAGSTVENRYSLMHNSFAKTATIVFDKLDHHIESYQFTNERIVQEEHNLFDEQGNCIENIQYYPAKKKEKITRYKYDTHHNAIETIVLNSSQMIESKVMARYDDRNNLRESFTYGIQGNLKEYLSHVYEYDEAGNWTKDIRFINKKPISVEVRKIVYY